MSSLSVRKGPRDLLAGTIGPDLARRLALAALTICVLAVAGPGGSWRLPGLARLAEVASCALGWELCVPLMIRGLRRWMGEAVYAASPWPFALAVLFASVPATACLLVALRWDGEQIGSLPVLYGESLLLGLLIAFARRGLFSGSAAEWPAADEPVAASNDPIASFLHRNATQLAGGRLLALQAEDHYLRIHTDRGSALILMRLRDAADALGPEAGWQPHRSFWLATGATAKAERHGQSWRLLLPTGLVVPVSRSNLGAMRAAGYGQRSA